MRKPTDFQNRTVTIYALIDPRDNQLRYVGRTVLPLVRRLKHHIHQANKNERRYCQCWIRAVLKDGHKPEIVDLETVPGSQWEEAEQFWIAYWKYIGADLTNLSIGGGGSLGYVIPQHVREKMSKSHTGLIHSPEHCAAVGAALKGKIPPPHVYEALRKAISGKPLTDETKKKLSAALKNRIVTEETRKKMSNWQRGKIISADVIKRVSASLRKNSLENERGVCLGKKKKWRALIFTNGKQIHLGSFNTREEALIKRKEAERLYWGVQ